MAVERFELERVANSRPLNDLLGVPETPVVECRYPVLGEPDLRDFHRRGGGTEDGAKLYGSRDMTEALGSPTVRDVIVPGPVDESFKDYMRDMFGVEPNLHSIEDLSTFSTETIQAIMERYEQSGNPAKFYGWWAVDGLPSNQQLVPPELQRKANQKAFLSELFPSDKFPGVLPHQVLFSDGSVRYGEKPLTDLTPEMLDQLKNGASQVVAKSSRSELTAGRGVTFAETVDDIMGFYQELKREGVADASILLEEFLPGEGGSFTLIRQIDGSVLFSHVTKQINVDGKRIGNVIHSIEEASPAMQRLINLTARQLSDPTIVPLTLSGVYAFDTIDDIHGIPRPNDPANRTTGTWTAAQQRIHLIPQFSLPEKDTVTGIGKVYVDPRVSFMDIMHALGKQSSDWTDNGITTVRSFYRGYGGGILYFANTTTDAGKLDTMSNNVRQSLYKADINFSDKINFK